MIPDIDPAEISNKGERDVYERLQTQLPKAWTVFHHYLACWWVGDYLRDFEADFIVVAPDKGLLCLEVKGSHGYDSQDGKWYRISRDDRREPTSNPFEQAMRNKHMIVQRIAQKVFSVGKEDFPGLFGHVVIYPFGKVHGKLPNSSEPQVMLMHKHMDKLGEHLPQAFKLWGCDQRAKAFTPEKHTKVIEFLKDDAKFVQVLAADADEDDRRIEELTRHQYEAFRSVLENARVLVTGPAGSGKTMIALWAAGAMAQEAREAGTPLKILFLCYSRTLPHLIKEQYGATPGFEVHSFFSLCKTIVEGSGTLSFGAPPTESDDNQSFWCEKAPALFVQALDSVADSSKYDAIFVDEAQDFHKDWWLPLQLLLKDPDEGPLYLFLDPDQAGVFGHGDKYPSTRQTFKCKLRENCRNTKAIAAYCGRPINKRIKVFERSPVGKPPEILPAMSSVNERSDAVRTVVNRFLAEGFHPSRIALLSPWKPTNEGSAISLLQRIGVYPVRVGRESLRAWLDGKCIFASTVKSFKGLEADCVVLVDVPEAREDSSFNFSDLYVAASRARICLVVIPSSSVAENQLRSWLCK